MKHLFKCNSCKKYTMRETCGCGNTTLSAKPLKYTPNDKYLSYRRKIKAEEYKKRGWL